jgi:hypothetical protein
MPSPGRSAAIPWACRLQGRFDGGDNNLAKFDDAAIGRAELLAPFAE